MDRVNPPQTLWGITTFFNPTACDYRLANYREFRKRSCAQGLPLCAVELAFGDAPFQLTPSVDAEHLIQLRSTSVLWQKERLLNIALSELPAACTGVCWIDADILFDDEDWVSETNFLLKKKAILQPFSACIRLPQGGRVEDFPSEGLDTKIPQGNSDSTYSKSVCLRMSGFRKRFIGTTGYVWCARKDVLTSAGFYDRCIVGGGDREIALAAHFKPGLVPDENRKIHYPKLRAHINSWHERLHPLVRGKVGYRKGVIYHLWHGDMQKRAYADRHALLEIHGYDPENDLRYDASGCWEFETRNSALIAAIHGYFESRREAS